MRTPDVSSKPADQTYGRPVSAHEWKRLGAPHGLIQEVQLCVEGDGAIDLAALAAAVDVASRACPGARLVRQGRQWVDSGHAPPVHLVAGADFDRARLDSPLLRRQLTVERKPSCEVLLVQGTPTTVIIRTHPMDGRGAMFWQRQVFRALRGESVESATSTVTCDEVKTEIAARLGIELPPPSPQAPGPEWRPVLGPLPSGSRRSIWRRRTIDGVHVGVTAKIARLIGTYGGGEGLVSIPVDLRQYLPALRATTILTGDVKLHVREDDDWTDADARLLTALSEYQFLVIQSDPMTQTMPLPFVRDLRRWTDSLARQNTDFVRTRKLESSVAAVAHLGAVELADFCVDGFEATSCYNLGAVSYAPEINVMESRGRTEVTVAWRDGPGVAERIEVLLDRIEEELIPDPGRGH